MINARRTALQQLSEVKSKGKDLATSLESSLAVLGEDNETVQMVGARPVLKAIHDALTDTDEGCKKLQSAATHDFAEAKQKFDEALAVLIESVDVATEVVDALNDDVKQNKKVSKKAVGAARYQITKVVNSMVSGGWPQAWAKEAKHLV
jgi:hypothetical protein